MPPEELNPAPVNNTNVTPAETVVPPVQDPAAQPVTPPVVPPVEPAKPDPAAKVVPEPEAKVVPENYDLKLPEGSKLEAAVVEGVASYAKENGLTNDQAQKLLDREAGLVKSHEDALANEYAQTVKSWQDATMKDKEIGGDNFAQNKELAFRAVDKFGGENFKKMLVETGYEHHPEVLRTFLKIGKAIADDKVVVPGSQNGPSSASHAKKLYDNPTSQTK